MRISDWSSDVCSSDLYGRFSTVEGEAFISGPVTDTLNIRLAGRSTYAGPWQKNYFSRPGDEFGKRRGFAGRITHDWKPHGRLRFMASLSGWHDIGRASWRESMRKNV